MAAERGLHLAPSPLDLTDRQFHLIYCHPRDKEGRLVPPTNLGQEDLGGPLVPQSLEEHLEIWEARIASYRLENGDEIRDKIRRKWEGKNGPS